MAADVQPSIDGASKISMTISGVTKKVLLDVEDRQVADADGNVAVGRVIEATAEATAFPALAEGVAATLDWPTGGTTYTVVSQHLEGALRRVTLRKT